jgi:hypothetical protein
VFAVDAGTFSNPICFEVHFRIWRWYLNQIIFPPCAKKPVWVTNPHTWNHINVPECVMHVAHITVVLPASFVSQFFSGELCGKWDWLLEKISLRASRVSQVSREGKNAIYCEAWKSHNFKVSIDSHHEISVCETHKKRVLLQNMSARLVRSKSRYEISVCKLVRSESCCEICLRDSWEASLLILTRKSR